MKILRRASQRLHPCLPLVALLVSFLFLGLPGTSGCNRAPRDASLPVGEQAAPARAGIIQEQTLPETGQLSEHPPHSSEQPTEQPVQDSSPPQDLPPLKTEPPQPRTSPATLIPAPHTTWEPAGDTKHCRVALRTLYSKHRSKTTHYFAFVPHSSGKESRFPAIYLLHGAYDDYKAWSTNARGLICTLVEKYKVIIITPDGDRFGWYADSPFDAANQIESYFIHELIEDVEKEFPANGERGISGLSMGGHGAMVLALRNPGKFSAVSSMSGILDITGHPTQWQLSRVFGKYQDENRRHWNEHSALKLLPRSRDNLEKMSILIAVSTGDEFCFAENVKLHQELTRMKIDHEFLKSPGGHTWTYWLSQLPIHVRFQAKHLARQVEDRESFVGH